MHIFYRFCRFNLFILGKILFKLEAHGQENIPKKDGIIFAPNHASHLDPIIAAIGAKRIIAFMARDTLFNNPVFGF